MRAVPILRIFDVAIARGFYLDYLAFSEDWAHRFEPDLPTYLQVSKDGLVLHLSEHHGDACPGSAVFVEATGLPAYQAALLAKRHPNSRPGLEPAPWGGQLMEIIDPFGNRLRFWEDTTPTGDNAP